MIWEHAPAAAAAFCAAVLVPLAVRALDEPDRAGRRAWTVAAARRMSWPAGALAAASFLLPAGPAFLMVAPYLAVVALVAAHGLARALRGTPASEVGIGLACVYLAGAAVWLGAHRAGYALLGYPPYWVALTATHFHVAGLVLPLAASFSARRGGPLPRLTIALVLLGVPATALAIGFSHRLEPVASTLMALGGLLLAYRYVAPAVRGTCGTWHLRYVAPAALCGSMPLAVAYAFDVGPMIGEYDALTSMVITHGALNLVFAVAALLMPRAKPLWERGVPLSRITARGRVGGDYFERMGIAKGEARGTCDRLEEFASATYDPAETASAIRAFYENVGAHAVRVTPRWAFGFRTGAAVWRLLALRIGQLALPVDSGAIGSRMVGLDGARDGRERPRAWIREDAQGRAMFVSAYATHRYAGRGYMNVAFPLPWCQMTSINRFETIPGGGVRVTSRADGPASDCGCWLVIGGVAVRLPFEEEIRLVPGEDGIVGEQHMRCFGIRFLRVDYAITRQPDEARVDVAADPAPPQP